MFFAVARDPVIINIFELSLRDDILTQYFAFISDQVKSLPGILVPGESIHDLYNLIAEYYRLVSNVSNDMY